MNLLTTKLLISSFILFSLTISTVKSQCCDFSPYYFCQWDYIPDSWMIAPSSLPSNALPGFYENDGYFAWLQDQSGSMKSEGTFDVTSTSSTFSFDYYFYTDDPPNQDYLRVFLWLPGHINGIQIASITTSEDKWKHYVVTCDYYNDYCCGSLSAIPCSGKLEIVGKLSVTPLEGIFGIDNICGEGEITTPTTTTPTTTTPTTTTPTTTTPTTTTPTTTTPTTTTPTTTTPTTTTPTTTTPTTTTPTTTTPTTTTPTTTTPTTTTPTTTTPYTLPPPIPSSCCEFEDNTCGFQISYPYWYWSANRPATIPNYDGDYFWSDEIGAIANTSLITLNYPYTPFSLSYYCGGGNIMVSFQQTGSYPLRYVETLSYSPAYNYWRHKSIQVDDLCSTPGYPCTGYFVLQVTSARSTFVVAIDNVDIDGQCHRSLPCCYFSDDLICDLNNITAGDYYWKWSGDSLPINPPSKLPGSDYVYFETVDYIGNEMYASLTTNEIEIPWDVVFRGNFYARTPDGIAGVQALQLNFYHTKTEVTTSMDFVKDTSSRWLSYTFYCVSVHGDCCQGEDICRGRIEFTAFVQTNGGSLIYGIDALEVDGKCNPFPGLTMISPSKNTTIEVPLYPHKILL